MAVSHEPADYVMDASALAKLFLDEPESQAFRAWYMEEVQKGATFAAPGLLGYEVAHLMAKNLDPPRKEEGRADWFARHHDQAMEGIRMHHDAARQAYPWTGKLTGYDASYMAVCHASRGCLVSYDTALLREAARVGVQTTSPK